MLTNWSHDLRWTVQVRATHGCRQEARYRLLYDDHLIHALQSAPSSGTYARQQDVRNDPFGI